MFINKYYKNLLIRGLIYGISLSALYFFMVAMTEYFGRFSSNTRLVLLMVLVGGLLAIISYYIVYPAAKLLKLGKRISYEKAARIIGKHFPEIDDKLLNAIQLEDIGDAQSDLLQASIDQKIERLSPVPFTTAINFRENLKYWPVMIIPVLIFLGVGLSGEWSNFAESGRRIAEFNREFIPVAPFRFIYQNYEPVIEEGSSYTIQLKLKGEKIPAEVVAEINNEEMRMSKTESGFSLALPSIHTALNIRFKAQGFYSKAYVVEVNPVPQLRNVMLEVVPPGYTRLKPSKSDLKTVHDVAEGSRLRWVMESEKVSKAWLVSDEQKSDFVSLDKNQFTYQQPVNEDMEYAIDVANDALEKRGVSGNRIHVIADQHPSIKVKFERDTMVSNMLFYLGEGMDDYGLTGVEMIIEEGEVKSSTSLTVSGGLSQKFNGVIDLDTLAGEKTKEVKVYFRVWDNDGVNGAKATTSRPFVVQIKGEEERKEDLQKGYQKYFETGKQEEQERKEIQKSLQEIRRSLLEKKSLSFKEKSKMKELLEKQEKLLKKQRENEELLEKLKKEEEKVKPEAEELEEEEKKIDELSEKDKEIEDLMKEIQELMEKLDRDKLQEKMQELEKMNETNQRKQDRKDELLKDLQLKKDILESADKLKELGEEMKKLAEESGEDAAEKKKQEEVEEKFEKEMDKLEQMKKDNESFDKESEKEELSEKGEQAGEEMEQASEKLQKQDSQGANKNQKKAGEKMEEMSQSLQNSMMGMQSQANKENIETLRQILENLETVSFDIEALASESRSIGREDPGIKRILKEQKRLVLGTKIIEDSLTALAARAPQIEEFVFDELDDMKYNLKGGIEHLQELETGRASANQQYVMTAANNLAVMLEKSLQNMQQMQAQMMQGQQQCQKPGSKPDGKTLKEMQSQMGKMMDRLKEGQKKGEMGKMSKEMVETISKQEQLRQALEEMQQEDGGSSGSKGSKQEAIEELKKLQDDLMEGRIADNYKERLKEIESRLLESEKADLKQKQDEKRESKTAENLKQLYKTELEKYLEEKGVENEGLQRLPVEFKVYYKGRISQYLSIQ